MGCVCFGFLSSNDTLFSRIYRSSTRLLNILLLFFYFFFKVLKKTPRVYFQSPSQSSLMNGSEHKISDRDVQVPREASVDRNPIKRTAQEIRKAIKHTAPLSSLLTRTIQDSGLSSPRLCLLLHYLISSARLVRLLYPDILCRKCVKRTYL